MQLQNSPIDPFEEHLKALAFLCPSEQKKSLTNDYESGLISGDLLTYGIFILGLEEA